MGAWGLRGKGGRWGEKISEGKSGDGKWQGRVEMEGVEECRKVKKGEEKGEGRSGWGMRSRAGSRAARRRRQERGGREARGGEKGGGERRCMCVHAQVNKIKIHVMGPQACQWPRGAIHDRRRFTSLAQPVPHGAEG